MLTSKIRTSIIAALIAASGAALLAPPAANAQPNTNPTTPKRCKVQIAPGAWEEYDEGSTLTVTDVRSGAKTTYKCVNGAWVVQMATGFSSFPDHVAVLAPLNLAVG